MNSKLTGAPTFSLVQGGPLHTLLRRAKLEPDDAPGAVGPTLAFIACCWAPMVVLALVQRLTSSHWAPIVAEWHVHVRLLVAVPFLLLGEPLLHVLTGRCIAEFVEGNFAPNEEEKVAYVVNRAARLRDSRGVEIFLGFVVVALSQAAFWTRAAPLGIDPSVGRSATDAWYALVALPVTQFLYARWLWRWALWTQVIWSLSRLDLRLVSLHPDGNGGVGFLGEPALAFAPGLAAFSTTLMGVWLDRIAFHGDTLKGFTGPFVFLLLFAAVVVLAPLAPWAVPLTRERLAGVREYAHFGVVFTRRFREKWLDGGDPAAALGMEDVQSLADLGQSFAVVHHMRVLPIDRRTFLVVVGAMTLPVLPIVFAEYSPVEVAHRALAAVFGSALH